MPFTQDEIDAELRKRGVIDDEVMQNGAQPTEIPTEQPLEPSLKYPRMEALLEQLGLGGEDSWLARYGRGEPARGAALINLPAGVGAGVAQGLGSSGASIANLVLPEGGKLPHPDLKKNIPEGMASDVGFLLGEIGGYGLGAGGAAKGLGKLAQAMQLYKPVGMSGVLAEALKGAGIGGAISENLPGGRGLGAALGGAGSLASQAMPGTAGKKVLEGQERAKDIYKKSYGNLFKDAERIGVSQNVRVPKVDSSVIKDGVGGSRALKAFEKFKSSPTLENAHKAQSDLGKLARKLEKIDMQRGLLSTERAALESALDAQARIRGSMYQKMSSKEGGQQLFNRYASLTEGYASDVVPFLQSKSVQQAAAGEISPSAMAKKLGSPNTREAYMFRQALGKDYPQVKMSAMMPKILKYGGGAAGLGLAAGSLGGSLYDELMGK